MYTLYSKNNQLIIKQDSSIVYLVNCNDSRIQVINGTVFIYDLFNRPNADGHTFHELGPITNIMTDLSTGFVTNEELYDYFSIINATHTTDFSGNPQSRPDLVDTTSELVIYEGYKNSATLYRICKIMVEPTLISRLWASGAWTDRTTLIYS